MKSLDRVSLKSIATAALLLLVAVLPASGDQGGSKVPHGKARLAPDLQESVWRGSPDQVVRVVANLNANGGSRVASDMTDLGGSVQGTFREVQEVVVDVPLGSLEALT